MLKGYPTFFSSEIEIRDYEFNAKNKNKEVKVCDRLNYLLLFIPKITTTIVLGPVIITLCSPYVHSTYISTHVYSAYKSI